MFFSALALLPELISFIAFFADVEHDFLRQLRCCRSFGSLGIPSLVLLDGLAWFRVDVDDHARALIAVVSALKLLKHQWRGFNLVISVAIEKALLDKVEAFASFCLMLLSYMLWSVSETGLFEKVVLGALVKARVAVVFVSTKELHRIVVLSNSELVKLVQRVLMVTMLFRILGVVMVSTTVILMSS